MRQVDIAVLLIKQGNNYLLQHRNGDPKIGAAGTYGCFGGKIDKNEEPKAAAIREIAEETNLNIDHAHVKELGKVRVNSDHRNEAVTVGADVFLVEIDPTENVEAKEGELITLSADEVKDNIKKLSTVTRATFQELIWR